MKVVKAWNRDDFQYAEVWAWPKGIHTFFFECYRDEVWDWLVDICQKKRRWNDGSQWFYKK